MPAPRIGQNVGGYIYQGGDPNSPSSWTQAGGAPARPARGGGRGATGPTTPGQTGQELRAIHQAADVATQNMADVGNFQDLNAQQETGGLMGLPGIGPAIVSIAAPFNSRIAGMRAITSRIAPQQRAPGSGSSSDRDVSLFIQGGPNVGNPRATNDEIIHNARMEATRRQARAAFMDQYASQNGNLVGAETQFETFWNANRNILQQLHQAAAPSGRRQRTQTGGMSNLSDAQLRQEFGH